MTLPQALTEDPVRMKRRFGCGQRGHVPKLSGQSVRAAVRNVKDDLGERVHIEIIRRGSHAASRQETAPVGTRCLGLGRSATCRLGSTAAAGPTYNVATGPDLRVCGWSLGDSNP